MRLYDSLRRAAVEFEPRVPGEVTVYGCGPTVYNFAHIGNFRTFLVYDLLHRALIREGYRVRFVVNLTDVDDKTIHGAAEAGKKLEDHTAPFAAAFMDDAASLGFLAFEDHPRATAYIDPMVDFIQRLVDRGHAYRADDGSVYFSVSSFPEYGRLSGNRVESGDTRSRIDQDEYEKGDARDFVLWKATKPVDGEVGAVWESPWGTGRPGWHLECSVMATGLLGDTVDIHLGGEDLLFPHHENEIAQSQGATGHPFVRFWLHVKHLKLGTEKMSKSAGNFFTVRQLLDDGYDPAAVRLALISAHYRSELTFTREGIDEASASVQRLVDFKRRVSEHPVAADADTPDGLEPAAHVEAFDAAIADDLNVPKALAALWGLVREGNTALDKAPSGISADARQALLDGLAAMDQVLGLVELAEASRTTEEGDEERIQGLVEARNAARANRDFQEADRIRDELAAEGIVLEDGVDGTKWKKVR